MTSLDEVDILSNDETTISPHTLPTITRLPYKPQCGWTVRTGAIITAVYCIVSSLLVASVYGWTCYVYARQLPFEQIIYFGVESCYLLTVVIHVIVVLSSFMLLYAVIQEYVRDLTIWGILRIFLILAEGASLAYSNYLRENLNKTCDDLCRAEVVFYVTRILTDAVAVWMVLQYRNQLKQGYNYLNFIPTDV